MIKSIRVNVEKYISKIVKFSSTISRVKIDEITNNIDVPSILFLYFKPRTVIFNKSRPISILPKPS